MKSFDNSLQKRYLPYFLPFVNFPLLTQIQSHFSPAWFAQSECRFRSTHFQFPRRISFFSIFPQFFFEVLNLQKMLGNALVLRSVQSSAVRPHLLTPTRLLTSTGRRLEEIKTPIQQIGWEYLMKQKSLGRPISPHLTIYKPQLTWMVRTEKGHLVNGRKCLFPLSLHTLTRCLIPSYAFLYSDLQSFTNNLEKKSGKMNCAFRCLDSIESAAV